MHRQTGSEPSRTTEPRSSFSGKPALGRAGVPRELLRVEPWMDAALPGPTVLIEIESEDGAFTMTSRNIPSTEEPRTSRIIAPSVMAALRAMVTGVRAGS